MSDRDKRYIGYAVAGITGLLNTAEKYRADSRAQESHDMQMKLLQMQMNQQQLAADRQAKDADLGAQWAENQFANHPQKDLLVGAARNYGLDSGLKMWREEQDRVRSIQDRDQQNALNRQTYASNAQALEAGKLGLKNTQMELSQRQRDLALRERSRSDARSYVESRYQGHPQLQGLVSAAEDEAERGGMSAVLSRELQQQQIAQDGAERRSKEQRDLFEVVSRIRAQNKQATLADRGMSNEEKQTSIMQQNANTESKRVDSSGRYTDALIQSSEQKLGAGERAKVLASLGSQLTEYEKGLRESSEAEAAAQLHPDFRKLPPAEQSSILRDLRYRSETLRSLIDGTTQSMRALQAEMLGPALNPDALASAAKQMESKVTADPALSMIANQAVSFVSGPNANPQTAQQYLMALVQDGTIDTDVAIFIAMKAGIQLPGLTGGVAAQPQQQ